MLPIPNFIIAQNAANIAALIMDLLGRDFSALRIATLRAERIIGLANWSAGQIIGEHPADRAADLWSAITTT